MILPYEATLRVTRAFQKGISGTLWPSEVHLSQTEDIKVYHRGTFGLPEGHLGLLDSNLRLLQLTRSALKLNQKVIWVTTLGKKQLQQPLI